MTVRIEDNRLMGSVTVNRQFLYNTGHEAKQYEVKIIFDGADISEVITAAVNDAVISARKKIKTPAQAERLANGISFHDLVSAKPPEDPNAKAASLDVDALDDDVFAMLLKKAEARRAKESS